MCLAEKEATTTVLIGRTIRFAVSWTEKLNTIEGQTSILPITKETLSGDKNQHIPWGKSVTHWLQGKHLQRCVWFFKPLREQFLVVLERIYSSDKIWPNHLLSQCTLRIPELKQYFSWKVKTRCGVRLHTWLIVHINGWLRYWKWWLIKMFKSSAFVHKMKKNNKQWNTGVPKI